tara:strand:- start:401 stop:562 length:162 start_codon:yes stop_codon:yes gene_type:complete
VVSSEGISNVARKDAWRGSFLGPTTTALQNGMKFSTLPFEAGYTYQKNPNAEQ